MQNILEDFGGDEVDYSTRFIVDVQFRSIDELHA